MAQVTLKTPRLTLVPSSTTALTQVLDGVTDSGGIVFKAPKTGNITKIHAYFSAVSGTPSISASIQGVSAGRSPDGTVATSGTATVSATPTAGAWTTFTLGAAAAVTVGNDVAAVVRYASGSTSATLDYGYTTSLTGANAAPFAFVQNGGTYSFSVSTIPTIAVEYDDGTVVGFAFRATSISTSWNSSANPLLRGVKWTPAATCVIDGAFVYFMRTGDSFDFQLELFQAGNGTPLVTIAIEPDKVYASTAGISAAFIPFAQQTLTAGTAYRLAVEPTTANSPTTALRLDFMDATTFASAVGGSEWAYTTNNAQDDSWTDTANQIVMIVPNIVSVDSGGGGGALVGNNALVRA